MGDPHKVSVDSLVEISEELIESFFFSTDIYALLTLALITVTTYSHKKHRLAAQTRIDLTIAFIPDLIQSLIKNKTITELAGKELAQQCEARRNELPLILQAYMDVACGLPVKVRKKETKAEEKKCMIS